MAQFTSKFDIPALPPVAVPTDIPVAGNVASGYFTDAQVMEALREDEQRFSLKRVHGDAFPDSEVVASRVRTHAILSQAAESQYATTSLAGLGASL